MHKKVSYPGSDQCDDFCHEGDYYSESQDRCVSSPFPFETINGTILSFSVSNSSGKFYIKNTGSIIELVGPTSGSPGVLKRFEILNSDEEGCFIHTCRN